MSPSYSLADFLYCCVLVLPNVLSSSPSYSFSSLPISIFRRYSRFVIFVNFLILTHSHRLLFSFFRKFSYYHSATAILILSQKVIRLSYLLFHNNSFRKLFYYFIMLSYSYSFVNSPVLKFILILFHIFILILFHIFIFSQLLFYSIFTFIFIRYFIKRTSMLILSYSLLFASPHTLLSSSSTFFSSFFLPLSP